MIYAFVYIAISKIDNTEIHVGEA